MRSAGFWCLVKREYFVVAVVAVAWHFNTLPWTQTHTRTCAYQLKCIHIYLLFDFCCCCLFIYYLVLLPLLLLVSACQLPTANCRLLTATTAAMMDGCTKSCSNTLFLLPQMSICCFYLSTCVRICFSFDVVANLFHCCFRSLPCVFVCLDQQINTENTEKWKN